MNAHLSKEGALGAADCLSLAAAPTFATMALLTDVIGGGPLDILCSAAPDASALTGMVPMYVLMSAFHLAPWLRLISRRRPRRNSNHLMSSNGGCDDHECII